MKKIIAVLFIALAMPFTVSGVEYDNAFSNDWSDGTKLHELTMKVACSTKDTIQNFAIVNEEIPFAEMVPLLPLTKEDKWPGQEVPGAMFVNPKTRTWTVVAQIDPDRFCILATGSYMQPSVHKENIEKQKNDEIMKNKLYATF